MPLTMVRQCRRQAGREGESEGGREGAVVGITARAAGLHAAVMRGDVGTTRSVDGCQASLPVFERGPVSLVGSA